MRTDPDWLIITSGINKNVAKPRRFNKPSGDRIYRENDILVIH